MLCPLDDEGELPRRQLRRCSVAGGAAAFDDHTYDDSEGEGSGEGLADDSDGESAGGRGRRSAVLSCSEGEDGTDGEGDDGEAYVPSRGPGAAGPAGRLSRPLDIPRAVPIAAVATRRKSIASVKATSLHAHAHGQYVQANAQRHSLTASHALSPSAAHTYGANSFVSAASASADSSSAAWAASPADAHIAGDQFYQGYVLAPSSLPVSAGLTMLPAVPLPMPSSRRSTSPFFNSEPAGRCHTDPAAATAAHPHRLNVAAGAGAMPSCSPVSSSYGLPYGPGSLQSRTASFGSASGSGGSSNTSPQGVAAARLSGSSTVSSGSFTFSAAARFLPPSGAGSSCSSSSYSSGAGGCGYGIGGGGMGHGSTFASPSSASSFSFSAAVSPLPPRPPIPSRFSSPPAGGAPSPSPPPALVGGGARGAQLEEMTSYEEVAACPPHVQANESRRTSVAASTAALDLSPAMQHQQQHMHARPLALRCAGRAERDALQFEEEEDDGLQGMLGNTATMPQAGSPQSGFELEFDL